MKPQGTPVMPDLTVQSGRDLHLYNEIGEEADTSQTSMDNTPQRNEDVIPDINDIEIELADLSSRRSTSVNM